MPDNTSKNEDKNIEHILSHLSRQQEDLNTLHKDYSALTAEWLISSAKAEAINQGHDIEKRLSGKIGSSLTQIKIFAAFFFSIIPFLGYFGVQVIIEEAVKKGFTEEIKEKVVKVQKETLKRSAEQLRDASKLYEDTKREVGQFKNNLIVLQTDFGADSPYMGVIKGIIYHVNPNARIDVITDQVPAYDTFEAAWILNKAVAYYPEHTIFVSITGDARKDDLPVILRNKEKGHIFIGYLNGVFDIVKPEDGFTDNYEVETKEFEKEWNKRMFVPRDKQLKNLGSNEYLGFIAGALSRESEPWSSPDENDFSWEGIAKPTNYTTSEEISDKIKHKSIAIESEHAILIKGTIMNIDRYGNANTNIPESFFYKALKNKNLELDDTTRVAVGIATDFSNHDAKENQDWIDLKEVKFSKNYSTVEVKDPLLTVINGKLQLAINQGDLSMSDEFLVNATEKQADKDSGRFVKSQMKIRIKVHKFPIPCHRMILNEGNGVISCNTSKK